MQSQTGFRGWEKWALISVLILGLSSILVYFNLSVFGIGNGWPYIAVVSYIVLLSFIVTRHIKRGKATGSFLTAAFVFEVLLCITLGLNVAYSLSVMREMSVAGEAEKAQGETIEKVSKLKGSRTQREALKLASNSVSVKSRQEVFSQNERWLFWIMIGELGIAGIATFTLLGLSVFDQNKNGIPDFLEKENEFPSEIETGK